MEQQAALSHAVLSHFPECTGSLLSARQEVNSVLLGQASGALKAARLGSVL